jgi:hypothetical protein
MNLNTIKIKYKMVHPIFNLYKKSLYVVIPFTTSVGFSSGLVEVFTSPQKPCPLNVFTNIIGYTTLGAFTGLTYPLTLPAIFKNVICD